MEQEGGLSKKGLWALELEKNVTDMLRGEVGGGAVKGTERNATN